MNVVTGIEQSGARLIPTEVPGVALTSPDFEAVVAGLRTALLRMIDPDSFVEFQVPPVISLAMLERLGYVDAFPHLLGTLHSFTGDRRRWREIQQARLADIAAWHGDQTISDVAALPATCYHLYPLVAGQTLAEPIALTAEASCYRHEATSELGRLRSFRMREFVRIGDPDEIVTWRERTLTITREWFGQLGLNVTVEAASDPFFGDAARLMVSSQREQELKWELLAELGTGQNQAIASANYHQGHFGDLFDIHIGDGVAHTACVAFGLERVGLALTASHGTALADWPEPVRQLLWPDNTEQTGGK